MIGRITIFVLIAGLVYLNYTVPSEEDHKAYLLTKIEEQYPVPEELQSKVWQKVDYSNFFVASFMKTTEGSTMISYGFLKKVKLVDDGWVAEVMKMIQRKQESSYY